MQHQDIVGHTVSLPALTRRTSEEKKRKSIVILKFL